MPSIKVPTKYVKKLKELGVYDEWLREFIIRCGDNTKLISEKQDIFHNYDSFHGFISASFIWTHTSKGSDFWSDISNK